jgi:hypothetical protein
MLWSRALAGADFDTDTDTDTDYKAEIRKKAWKQQAKLNQPDG